MSNYNGSPGSAAPLSRRELLWGASAGIAATLAEAALAGCNRASDTAPGRFISPSGTLTPASMPKSFSQEELRRRW